MSEEIEIDPLADVIADFQAGKQVIIVDDDDRENEGDLTLATEMVTPEAINFMMQEARGLICVSLSAERAAELNLPLQVANNSSPFETPFAVSVDHRNVRASAVTAAGRAATLRALVDLKSAPNDFLAPGHVFPLIAHPAGVIGRQGQTEGSYDLARIAGFQASGIICEILSEDGTMARGAELNKFAKKHDLKITSVEEIIRYRVNEEILVRRVAESELETDYGCFKTYAFQDDVDLKEHLALVLWDDDILDQKAPLVRLHSECLTGDVFGSERCDCRKQLDFALKEIRAEGAGILLYLRQEGRGIGLANKLRAYELQDKGRDTVDANLELGFDADQRDYAVAAKMLQELGVDTVRLLTNNPDKIKTLQTLGIRVAERIPIWVPATDFSRAYLETKRDKLGHLD